MRHFGRIGPQPRTVINPEYACRGRKTGARVDTRIPVGAARGQPWTEPGGPSGQGGRAPPSAGGGVVRGAQGISGVADGTALAFTLLTPSGEVNEVVANQVKENLGACGVDVSIEVLDPALFLSEWPDGPVFGRGFGLVAWAWRTLVSPVCETFLTGQVPSDDSPLGINASGFSDAEYDSACQSLLLNLPAAAAFDDGARKTQQIIADQFPATPLSAPPG